MKPHKFRIASFIVLLFSCNYSLFSQIGYSPFPEKYGRWLIEKYGPTGPDVNGPAIWYFTSYETAGDTIIGGVIYKKVMATAESNGFSPPPINFLTYDFGPKHLVFAYRNDIPNKKVYILTDTNEIIDGNLRKEYVWYDFNSKVGDTLKRTFSIKPQLGTNNVNTKRSIVRRTDSIYVCGNYQKIFYFSCSIDLQKMSLLEGVGFRDNFIKTDPYCPFEPVYLYTTYFSCSPTAVDELKSAPSFFVFPNPVFQALKVKWSEQPPHRIVSCSIVNCLGKVVLENADINESINISALANGLYFIIITDKEGNHYKSKFIKQ